MVKYIQEVQPGRCQEQAVVTSLKSTMDIPQKGRKGKNWLEWWELPEKFMMHHLRGDE